MEKEGHQPAAEEEMAAPSAMAAPAWVVAVAAAAEEMTEHMPAAVAVEMAVAAAEEMAERTPAMEAVATEEEGLADHMLSPEEVAKAGEEIAAPSAVAPVVSAK